LKLCKGGPQAMVLGCAGFAAFSAVSFFLFVLFFFLFFQSFNVLFEKHFNSDVL